MRPVLTDDYLIELTLTKEHLEGRNTPEQNALCRALEARSGAILAALGYGEGYGVKVVAGERKGQLYVTQKGLAAPVETDRFDLSDEWRQLMHDLDSGTFFEDDWTLAVTLMASRPRRAIRVRQTTVEDVRRRS